MFKYILVPATGAETDAPVFATALAVARLSGAHLEFLHVRIDVQKTVMAIAAADMGGGTGYDQLVETLEQDVATRLQRAEAGFHAFCEQERLTVSRAPAAALPSAEWNVETGDEPAWLVRRGRAADLLVVGRSREDEGVAMDVLEASLMATGRPVLIASNTVPRRVPGTVVIAWKDTPEAARAVTAALPFLASADHVIIATINENEGHDDESCDRIQHAVQWHNANTTVLRLKVGDRSPVETLLSAATASKADLLVMGGYGHSRVREFIFGGFTRHVLQGADLPILITH
jgi:nucleotide-binding universal stress UspA family protein